MKKIIAQYHLEDVSYCIIAVCDGYIDPYDLNNIEDIEILRNDVLVLGQKYLGQTIPTYEYIARYERNQGQFHKLLKGKDPT